MLNPVRSESVASAGAVLLLTVDDARQAAGLYDATEYGDAAVHGWVKAATVRAESYLRRPLLVRDYIDRYTHWPDRFRCLRLSLEPVRLLNAATEWAPTGVALTYEPDGAATVTVADANYSLDTTGERLAVRLDDDFSLPALAKVSAPIAVQYTVNPLPGANDPVRAAFADVLGLAVKGLAAAQAFSEAERVYRDMERALAPHRCHAVAS